MTAGDGAIDRVEKTGFAFLMIDLELGMTMTRISAGAGSDSDKKNRNQENARQAYDSLLHFREQISFSQEEMKELDGKLEELKLALESLGDCF